MEIPFISLRILDVYIVTYFTVSFIFISSQVNSSPDLDCWLLVSSSSLCHHIFMSSSFMVLGSPSWETEVSCILNYIGELQIRSLRQEVAWQNPDQFSVFVYKVRAPQSADSIHVLHTQRCHRSGVLISYGWSFCAALRLLSGFTGSTLHLLFTDGWGGKAPGFVWEDQLKQPDFQGPIVALLPIPACMHHPCSQFPWLTPLSSTLVLFFHFISDIWRFYCLSFKLGNGFLSHCSFLWSISMHF